MGKDNLRKRSFETSSESFRYLAHTWLGPGADVARSQSDAARSRGRIECWLGSRQMWLNVRAYVATMETTLAAVKKQQYGMKSLARKDDFRIKNLFTP